LRWATGDWRLVLVDDCSTDRDLAEFLRETAEANERVIYLRNEVNGGFVVTANRGMREAAGRDVLLLNSDTIVTSRFIEKHIKCVYADDTTGIATPFTNNGTICSIPEFCRDNALPEDLSVDEYAALVERVSPNERPEIVTAVGFCMYVRAKVIEQIGLFDETAFGRGFGEENDFCERAKKNGWRIRLVDDCFVAHMGKASFGDEGRALEHENSRTLAKMHPNYFADVAAFCAENPLRLHQDRIRFELARHAMRQYPAALFVLHAPMTGANTGGTEHFVQGLVESLALTRSVVVWPEGRAIVALEIDRGRIDQAVRYRYELAAEPSFFCLRDDAVEHVFDSIIEQFDIRFAHIHHLIRWPIGIWRRLMARSIPFGYTIHDYYCVCPSWNLVRRDTGAACQCPGASDPKATRACIAAQYGALNMTPPDNGVGIVESHRREFAELLEHAAAIFAPSEAAAEVARKFHACAMRDVHVIGHGYDVSTSDSPAIEDVRDCRGSGPLKVAILGQVAYPAKGADAYVELMTRTATLGIEWHVFGGIEVFGYRRRLESLGLGDQLILHGDYQREEIVRLLRDAAIDLTLILPHCAETFCFTLSESWLAGIPVIVTRMGALPERVGATGAGLVVDNIDEVFGHLERFSRDRSMLEPHRSAARSYRHASVMENAAQHRQCYGNLIAPLEEKQVDLSVGVHDAALFAAHQCHLAASRRGVAPPRYQAKWWYAHYLRIKPMIPPGLRGAMKRAYLRVRRVGAENS
ncbi:MAG: glycosyltransferase, partial [Phycisphaerales bacterium]|nr:glycosyltransferase [Phycisphaerales bacterium]